MAERKKYINVEIPILRESIRVLGTAKSLHDKTIKLDLTRKLRGKGLTVTFRIFNHEEKLIAAPNSMELVKFYIRRMTRKRTNYVEDSFQVRCKDFRATIKPLLITRKRVSRAVRKNLRNTAREFLIEYVKERDYYEICQELLDGTLQKTLLPKLKKVYPLSFCDLRVFETKELEKIDLTKIITENEESPQEEIVDQMQEIEEDSTEEETEKPEDDDEELKEEEEDKVKKNKTDEEEND